MLELPWPPSANRYWRHVGSRVLVSKEAKSYREVVAGLWMKSGYRKFEGRLSVHIGVCPPNSFSAKQRDLGNCEKIVVDALQLAGAFDNDNQIDDLWLRRLEIVEGGRLNVHIETWEGE